MTIYLGQNIKYLRETKLKITKLKFGELIDIKSSTIGKYEENTNRPSFEVLIKLQQLFDVNLHDLIFTNLELISNIQTSEPEQAYHKINVLDELCELGHATLDQIMVYYHKNDIIDKVKYHPVEL